MISKRKGIMVIVRTIVEVTDEASAFRGFVEAPERRVLYLNLNDTVDVWKRRIEELYNELRGE